MEKLKAIIKREYLTRVRSKGFIIGTIISPLLMMSFAVVPVLISRAGGPGTYRVTVLDQTGSTELFERINKLLEPEQARDDKFILKREEVPDGADLDSLQRALNQEIVGGNLDGYLVLPKDVTSLERIIYTTKNVGDFGSRSQIGDAISRAIVERRVTLAGLDTEEVRRLIRDVRLDLRNARGEKERGQTFILSFGLLMIIYITILVYGVMVMRGVIEEKQSRIIEVLLSSVRPFELLLGKLIGIGMVGLTQYLVWATFGLGISLLTTLPVLAANRASLPTISPLQLIFFVVYFVLGYFLYATLYATVGAIVSNEEDGQQMQMPVTMTIVIPVMVSTLVMRNPNGSASVILSLIPFFSPVLMFLRIGLQTPPWWQIALSVALMIVTILAVIWLAAKIYRVGVLMYGKRPTLPEIVRWLRYT
ncbi:MAG: ABC transporter permease [Acidobacteriota bacterium]|nr:MAG: ABC transporter permease [Acidobacteriota bacterium]